MVRHGISPCYGQPSHATGMSLAAVGCSAQPDATRLIAGVDASSMEAARWQDDKKVDPCLHY